jgi:hypothetical protein
MISAGAIYAVVFIEEVAAISNHRTLFSFKVLIA